MDMNSTGAESTQKEQGRRFYPPNTDKILCLYKIRPICCKSVGQIFALPPVSRLKPSWGGSFDPPRGIKNPVSAIAGNRLGSSLCHQLLAKSFRPTFSRCNIGAGECLTSSLFTFLHTSAGEAAPYHGLAARCLHPATPPVHGRASWTSCLCLSEMAD